jgi:hypothetical protein
MELILKDIVTISGRVATILMLVPLMYSIIYLKNSDKALKIMQLFCFIRFIISILTQSIIWIIKTNKDVFIPILNFLDIHNMNFISILAHLSNFSILGWYFSVVIINKKTSQIIISISILLFVTSLLNYFFVQGYKDHNVFNSTSSNIFCFILPSIHLWFLYLIDSKVQLYKNPYFWVSFGLIIPNLFGLLTSIISKKLHDTDLVLYYQVDIVYILLQIIGYFFISKGFYYARYTKYMPKATQQ